MSKHADLGTMILGALEGRYPLEKQDIGADARLRLGQRRREGDDARGAL